MPKSTNRKILYEIEQIDELLSAYSPLLKLTSNNVPDLIEISALATLLHSFYGGIENIFTIISKEIDSKIPTGNSWHRDLLKQMTVENEFRDKLLDTEDQELLLEYLSFRHFFRHAYSFRLDWDQIKPITTCLSSTWERIREKLFTFVSNEGNAT